MAQEYNVNTIGHWQGIEETLKKSSEINSKAIVDNIKELSDVITVLKESLEDDTLIPYLNKLENFVDTYDTNKETFYNNKEKVFLSDKVSTITDALATLGSKVDLNSSSVIDIINNTLIENVLKQPLEELYEFLTAYNTERQEHFTNDYVPYINGKISAVLTNIAELKTMIEGKLDILNTSISRLQTELTTQGNAIVSAINALKPAS